MNEADLLAIDLFSGDKDDAGARMTSTKMVTTRKPQTCRFDPEPHSIPVGTRARIEEAIIDDKWCRFYVCVPCLTDWVGEYC